LSGLDCGDIHEVFKLLQPLSPVKEEIWAQITQIFMDEMYMV
jgi:hypothetical protein